MRMSYKRLWKLLIDRNLKKKDLMESANISGYTLARMNKGENVSIETLAKICKVLKFDLYFFFKNKCDKKFNKRELPRNIETTYFNKITVTKIFKKAEINRVTLVRLLLLIWQ